MSTSPAAIWDLNCELLFVEESDGDLVLDAVTVCPHGAGEDHLPAGTPVTWWLVDPSGGPGHLAAQLQSLAQSENECRIGTIAWRGHELLIASDREDCVVVFLTSLTQE
jgi:hypothetical protein